MIIIQIQYMTTGLANLSKQTEVKRVDRILKIENSGRTTKLTFAGIDFSTCIYGLLFDHFGKSDSPMLELKIDIVRFAEIIARCSDEDLREAAAGIQEYANYYREYSGINKICRPE